MLWPSVGLLIVPPVLAFFVMGQPIGLDMPDPLGNRFNLTGGIQIGAPLIALWFALSIYTGAFIAENVRAGIQAVSKGQTEAASALGLRSGRVMSLVARHHSSADLAVPQYYQELLACDCGGLCGHHGNAGGHHPQPDRPRD
jgi:ABC-type amino acid transport system permease subunit